MAAMIKATHTHESREATESKSEYVINKLKAIKLKVAGRLMEKSIYEMLTYNGYSPQYRLRIKTNNPMNGSSRRPGGEPRLSARSRMAMPS